MGKVKPSESYLFKPPWTFRRGFVEHLFATADTLVEHGAALAEQYPIRSLAIDKLTAESAKALSVQPWMQFIDSLSTGSPAAPLRVLLSSERLRPKHLRISVKGSSLRSLLELPALSELRTLVVDVPDDRAAAATALAVAAPTTLERLRFESRPNPWGSATGQRTQAAKDAGVALAQMLGSGRLGRLRSLALDVLDAATVEALADYAELDELTVKALPDSIGPALISKVLPHLRSLRLDWVGAETGKAFALAQAPRLEDLALKRWISPPDENRFDLQPLDLRHLHAPALRRLQLTNCGFDTEVIDGLHALAPPRLAALSLETIVRKRGVSIALGAIGGRCGRESACPRSS